MSALPLAHDAELRASPDELIAEHATLVRRLARKVHRSASAAIDLEELIQTGMLALVVAARTFVPRGEATFATYATMRVRGAMIDLLRQSATINRGAMRRRKKLKEAEAELERSLGRAPTPGEVAGSLGLTATDYRSAVDNAQPVYLEPLDAVYSDRSSWFACTEPNAEERLQREGLRDALAGAIARLPRREALVLQLYFVEELTLEEIGDALDVGAARVCQIKKQALTRLRDRLSDSWR
jgi:RNA polymerase sigma factor for flagellar operon FliA